MGLYEEELYSYTEETRTENGECIENRRERLLHPKREGKPQSTPSRENPSALSFVSGSGYGFGLGPIYGWETIESKTLNQDPTLKHIVWIPKGRVR
jgi:hypothetical protein